MRQAEPTVGVIGGVARFLWQTLTRFAKSIGCLAILSGVVCAGWLFSQAKPMIDSVRYRESALTSKRLERVAEYYSRTQRAVMEFNGASALSPEYAAASFTPKFPVRFDRAQDFEAARAELAKSATGKEALKRFVTDRFEKLVAEIQRTLMAHAASLGSANAPSPPPVLPSKPVDAGVYSAEVDSSAVKARRETLDDAKQVLGTLRTVAENPQNQKKLDDAVSELTRLGKLFPEYSPSVLTRPPPPPETTDAEKVASRLSELRSGVRQALLSSWALDEAYDQALETVEAEHQRFHGSDLRVRQMEKQLHLSMAVAMTTGLAVGVFFLLIGDWTQKASTEVLDYWSDLVPGFSGSPKEVYECIESAVKEREIPGLECTREFWHEGGATSAKREYLRFARERMCFEICAAPFGRDYFVSYRATRAPVIVDPLGIIVFLLVALGLLLALTITFGLIWGGILLILGLCLVAFLMRTAVIRGLGDLDRVFMRTPLLGPLYELYLRPITYYRIDSEVMYLKSVQAAVAESVNSMFGEHGISMIPETNQPPPI